MQSCGCNKKSQHFYVFTNKELSYILLSIDNDYQYHLGGFIMIQARKLVNFTAVLLVSSLFLAGCGADTDTKNGAAPASTTQAKETPAAKAPQERVLKDAMGHDVKIPGEVKRVMAPFLEDGLTAIGIKPVAQWSLNR
jgi:iron complex transport system substrate-binding protein